MNRTICCPVVAIWLCLFAVCSAQDSKAPAKPAEPKESSAGAGLESAAEAELSNRRWRDEAQALLRKPTDVEFADYPIEDAVKFLAEFHNARIRLDRTALNAQQSLAPVTISAVGQPLSHVLNRLMQAPDLAWTVHRGDIVVTTPNGFNNAGESKATFNDASDLLNLISVETATPGTFRWQIMTRRIAYAA